MTLWVKRLLIACVAVYALQLALPITTAILEFVPWRAFVRPWTFITYMFLHDPHSITHILFNLLVLYFFGPRVEERLGSNHFIRLYLISGVVGAILSMILSP